MYLIAICRHWHWSEMIWTYELLDMTPSQRLPKVWLFLIHTDTAIRCFPRHRQSGRLWGNRVPKDPLVNIMPSLQMPFWSILRGAIARVDLIFRHTYYVWSWEPCRNCFSAKIAVRFKMFQAIIWLYNPRLPSWVAACCGCGYQVYWAPHATHLVTPPNTTFTARVDGFSPRLKLRNAMMKLAANIFFGVPIPIYIIYCFTSVGIESETSQVVGLMK